MTSPSKQTGLKRGEIIKLERKMRFLVQSGILFGNGAKDAGGGKSSIFVVKCE
jgi:hypothetical protein